MASLYRKTPTRPLRRRITGWCSVFLFLLSLLPLVNRIVGIGVIIPALGATLGMWWGFGAPLYREKAKGWKRALFIAFVVVLCLLLALGTVISTLMLTAAVKKPTAEATLIVLGALVIGDQPSRMLKNRLDVAADYLTAHPNAHCVVSGGQGANEDYTEAYVMKTYLVEQKGIDPARILEEDKSTSTFENIRFSLPLIEAQGWESTVVIATQEFHQYRAKTMVQQAGGRWNGAVTCVSPHHLFLCYWVRECAAICRLWILGY